MEERYQELYRLPGRFYLEGSPVLVEAGAIRKDTKQNTVFVQLKICNLSNKNIKACEVGIKTYVPGDEDSFGIEEHFYLDLNAKKGDFFGTKDPIYLTDQSIRKIIPYVKKVVFADDTAWSSEVTDWETVATGTEISSVIRDLDLLEQLRLNIGEEYRYVPEIRQGLFRCACGTANLKDESKCRNCGHSYHALVSAMSEERLKADFERRKKWEKEEQEATEKAAALEKEKERQKKEKNKKTFVRLLVVAVALSLLIVAGVVTKTYILPAVKYGKAQEKMYNHEYEAAREVFLSLGNYKDSEEKAKEALYQIGKAYMIQERFDEATNVFGQISDYLDSSELEAECNKSATYALGNSLFESGDFKGAEERFESLYGFKDSEEKAVESRYNRAKAAYEQADYENALSIFQNLSDQGYSDSDEWVVASKYAIAVQALNNKDYKNAKSYFEELPADYMEVEEKLKEATYYYALSVYDQKKYEDALFLFAQLKTYKDANTWALECKYSLGLDSYKRKDYDMAVAHFEGVGDYKDALEMANKCKYEYVKEKQDFAFFLFQGDNTDIYIITLKSREKYESWYKINGRSASNNAKKTVKYLVDIKKSGFEDSKELYAKMITIFNQKYNYNSREYYNISSIEKSYFR